MKTQLYVPGDCEVPKLKGELILEFNICHVARNMTPNECSCCSMSVTHLKWQLFDKTLTVSAFSGHKMSLFYVKAVELPLNG